MAFRLISSRPRSQTLYISFAEYQMFGWRSIHLNASSSISQRENPIMPETHLTRYQILGPWRMPQHTRDPKSLEWLKIRDRLTLKTIERKRHHKPVNWCTLLRLDAKSSRTSVRPVARVKSSSYLRKKKKYHSEWHKNDMIKMLHYLIQTISSRFLRKLSKVEQIINLNSLSLCFFFTFFGCLILKGIGKKNSCKALLLINTSGLAAFTSSVATIVA